jgi:hypothetical protein
VRQTAAITAFLENMKVNYNFIEDNHATDELLSWQKRKILKGLEDIRMGRVSSSADVCKRAKQCI